MNILAIMGSYRKGRTIDTLMAEAIKGAKHNNSSAEVEQIDLIDKYIEYCKNCMACRKVDPQEGVAKCVIQDDMQATYPQIDRADAYIFGSPINEGTVTAVMKTFLERTTWVYSRAGNWPVPGCPTPRNTRKKKAIIILSSGIISPLFRRWCDDATPLIKSHCECMFNAKVLGSLYAGAVEKKGLERYLPKANKLGRKLSA